MAGYLTLSEFRARTIMPPEQVDSLEQIQAGWIAFQIDQVSRRIDARLGKRYRVPFTQAPEVIKQWVTAIVTRNAYLRRGIDQTDEQSREVIEAAKVADDEVKEAADAQIGLFDLPLSDAVEGSGVMYGGPRVYSEASPYVGGDVQREAGRNEDRNRRGS